MSVIGLHAATNTHSPVRPDCITWYSQNTGTSFHRQPPPLTLTSLLWRNRIVYKRESEVELPFDQCITNHDKSSTLPWRERSVKLNGAVSDTKTPTPSPTLLQFLSMATKLCNRTEAWRSGMKDDHSGQIMLRKWSKQNLCYRSSPFFKVLSQKLRKMIISCMSVCLSVRMEQLGSHWTDLLKIWY